MTDSARTVADPPLRRALWRCVGQFLFRMTPYGSFRARRFLLRLFGAKLTSKTKVRRAVHIDRPWNLRIGAHTVIGDDAALRARAPITIGDRCTVSQLAILTTERRDRDGDGVAGIVLGDDAWVATDALVLPGTTVGAGAVVGARSTASGQVPAWTIVAGDPAVPRRQRIIAPNP